MILFDFSQIVVSAAVDYSLKTGEEIDAGLLRHIALNNILTLKDKLNKYADEVVLCLDGRNYWRKEVFPHYKRNRKKSHEKDRFDWSGFYKHFNVIKQEFAENLPYKVVEVEGAEADDVIAVLCKVYGNQRDVVIVSSDKDFLQIQQNIASRVKQYSPFHRKFISPENKEYSLFEHIVRGDAGDGIPNILSDADVFMCDDKRSKPLRVTRIKEWEQYGVERPECFCSSEAELDNFIRNRTLIDLRKIPDAVVTRIVDKYNSVKPNKMRLFNYLVKNKLNKILERANF